MVTDDRLKALLHGLGVDPGNARAVMLLPLVEVAWADGHLHAREREAILRIAHDRGLLDGEGERLLRSWLSFQPSPRTFARARMAVAGLAEHQGGILADIVDLSEQVARAAGGLLHRVGSVSSVERAAIEEIAQVLHARDWRTALVDEEEDTSDERTDSDVPLPVEDLGDVGDAEGPPVAVAAVRIEGDETAVPVSPEVTVGRGSECTLVVAGDGEVSRTHCRLWREAERVYVVDCGSTNGTWVQEERFLERRLFGGERIRVGQTNLRFLAQAS